jgi:hypothetical protein
MSSPDVAAMLAEHYKEMTDIVAKALAEIHQKVDKVLSKDLDFEDQPNHADLLTGTLTCGEWRYIRHAIEQARELIRSKGGG